MKEKLYLYKKKIILTILSIMICISIGFGGLYIKSVNSVKDYKSFCNSYFEIDKNISKNEEAYLMYVKAIKNYVTVFTKYEGHAKLSDDNKVNIEKETEEYNGYINELKKLNPPQEFKDDYKKLIDLYDKDSIRKENINRDFTNNNANNIKDDYLIDNKDLTQLRNDFQSKITIISKQKDIKLN